jgi:RNA polymerase sigma-54 factor
MQQSLALSQRMELKLQMTTQMIQSIELLQLPLLALQERVEQELEENPALETEETSEGIAVDASADPEIDDTAVRAFEEELSDLQQEWNQSLGSSYRPTAGDEDPKYEAMQNTAAPGPSLRDFLAEQLHMMEVEPRRRDMAELIIYNLDPGGLLRIPLEEVFSAPQLRSDPEPEKPAVEDPVAAEPTMIGLEEVRAARAAEAAEAAEAGSGGEVEPEAAAAAAVAAPPVPEPQAAAPEELPAPIEPPPDAEEMEEALGLVQSLDPAGVGARTTSECILIQLRRSPGDTAFEQRLVEGHFNDLVQNRLPKIAKDMGVDLDMVKESIEIIATMNPRPGALFGSATMHYVHPDLVVDDIDGRMEVQLNDWGLPRLRVSQSYIDMLRERRKDKQLREYIQEKLRSARWLIEAINQRKSTLLRIAKEVVELQREFVEKGVHHLKPLPMQEVADRLGLHVSTVSRAMTDKYIQTPQGVYPLRFFIVGGYRTADGDAESAPAVMARIKEMVDAEDSSSPLTDQQIVEHLRSAGLDVARRTVAKYRDRLGIAGSRQRKKY